MSFAGRVAVLLAVCLCGWGCGVAPDPKALHDRISAEITHGDFNSASSDVERAYPRFASTSPEWDWSFRIQKAQILIYRGMPRDALALLADPLPSSLASTEIAVLKPLFEGRAHTYAQEFDASQEKLAEAERLANSSHLRLLCQVMNAKAALAAAKGDYPEAENDYDQALKLAREHGRSEVETAAQVGRAWVAIHRQHFDEAAERGKSALALSRSLGMQGLAATTLGNLGWNYSELGDYETALEFYKQATDEAAKAGMLGQSQYWFSSIANAYMDLREYSRAEDVARSTLKRAVELKNAEISIVCLNTLSDIMLRTDRTAEAEKLNQEALEIVKESQEKFGALDTWTTAGRVDTAKGDFSAAEAMYQRVLSDPNAGPQFRWASYAGLARTRDKQGNYLEAEKFFLEAIDTIEQARQSIDHDELRLSFLTSGIAIYGQYIDFLVQRGRLQDALKEAELSRARTLAEGLGSDAKSKPSGRSIPPQQLAQRLKATLLFYWLGESQSHLWVITPAKTTHLLLPAASEIDPLVKSYSETLLRSRDPLESANSDAQKLYTALVQPAEKLFPKNSRVILLPDGSLYGLNFETLIVADPKPHYWIEDVTLSTASSLTLLASAAERSAPSDKSLFLVGDTVSPTDEFPALPQAAAEMRDVEKYFPAPRRSVLSGGQATPTAYLNSQPEKFSYVHFVTHGTASRARPLESAVVLSKEKDADAFKLYARDIVKRRISAYLVTISACNGAGTRAYSGEGLVGLSWAFLRAGAHNVIGALWEVNDSSTPQLMDALYDSLSHGQDPATALRAAKLSLLHSGNIYRKPLYWAPFQLYIGS